LDIISQEKEVDLNFLNPFALNSEKEVPSFNEEDDFEEKKSFLQKNEAVQKKVFFHCFWEFSSIGPPTTEKIALNCDENLFEKLQSKEDRGKHIIYNINALVKYELPFLAMKNDLNLKISNLLSI